MPYRRLTIFIVMIFIAGLAKAQAPKIVYSETEKDDSRRTNFEIIGKLNGNFLIYKANRNDDAICIYDNDMKLKDRVKLDFTPEQQLINVDFVAYPDFFYVIYEFQRKGVVHCMAAKLDPNVKLLTEPIELDTTQIGFAGNNKIYTTMLYNKDLLLQHKDRMGIQMEERNDFFTDFLLTNDGELVFGKFLRQNYNEYITKL